ncbi:negative regulation of synapse maturation [Branchiostoma belcheri]|nr:negative regulation of synapse maturation [Branchiostoma belcheri]
MSTVLCQCEESTEQDITPETTPPALPPKPLLGLPKPRTTMTLGRTFQVQTKLNLSADISPIGFRPIVVQPTGTTGGGPDPEKVRYWTRKDVKKWIKSSWPEHLQYLRRPFFRKKINGEALLSLSMLRLERDFDVNNLNDKHLILDKIQQLRFFHTVEKLSDQSDEDLLSNVPMYQNYDVLVEQQVASGGGQKEKIVTISRAQVPALWKNLSVVQRNVQLKELDSRKTKLQEAKYEILSKQSSYMRSLQVLADHFEDDETLMFILGPHYHRRLFAYVDNLLSITTSVFREMKKSLHDDVMMTTFCKILWESCSRYFHDYEKYCRSMRYQEILLEKLSLTDQLFKERLSKLEGDPCCRGNNFNSFLVVPMQHLTRLPLLLETVLKYAPSGSDDEKWATEALKASKVAIKRCNEAARSMADSMELQGRLSFNKTKGAEVASPERWLEKIGNVTEVREGKNKSSVQLIVCNDLVLLAQKEQRKLEVVDYAARGLVEVQPVGAAVCRAFGKDKPLYQVTFRANHEGKPTERVLYPDSKEDTKLLELLMDVRAEQLNGEGQTFPGVYGDKFATVIYECDNQLPNENMAFLKDDVVRVDGTTDNTGVWLWVSRVRDGRMGILPNSVLQPCVRGTPIPGTPIPGTPIPGTPIPGGLDSERSPIENIKQCSSFDDIWSLAKERLDAPVNTPIGKFNVVSSNFAAGVFDERGGHLGILEKGISLFIPPGAIAGGPTKVYIYLESIDVHLDENLPEGQAMMSSTLYCGPPGTQFNEDVVFTLPYQGSGCDAMWNVFPVQTQTAVGETPNWRALADDVQAMHFLNNGFCTYFVNHFTGFGVVGDFSRSGGAKVKIFRFGAFASPIEMRGNNRRVRVRCWDGKKSELERVLQLEKTEHSGKPIDAHRPLPLREGQGDVWMAATDTSSGWQLRGCGEQSIQEILLWMEEDEPVDPSCTFEFRTTDETPGRFGCTVKIYQEETPKTPILLSVTDFEESHQDSSVEPQNEPPDVKFLRLQPELQPIKQDGALLPPSAHRQICTVLDVHNTLGNDWRAFAEKLGLQFDTICWVEGKCPTARLLYYWEHTNAGGGLPALRGLKRIFQELEREDVTEILKEAISLYCMERSESSNEERRYSEPAVTEYRERSDTEQYARRTSDSVIVTTDRGKTPRKAGSQGVHAGRVPQQLTESSLAISVF